jgi:hypothetical protein
MSRSFAKHQAHAGFRRGAAKFYVAQCVSAGRPGIKNIEPRAATFRKLSRFEMLSLCGERHLPVEWSDENA